MPAHTGSSGFGVLFRPALTVIAVSVLILFAAPVLGLRAPIPLDYNEGWNAYAAMRALGLGGGPLYPAPGGLIANNYPPLSFFVTGCLGLWFGDMIVAGRVIALLSLLASAGLAGAIARHCGARGPGIATTVLLPLLYVGAFSHDYVAMDDPQWFGIAIMLTAVLVFVSGSPRPGDNSGLTPGRLVITAALMVTAGMVKHNVLTWPSAVTLELAIAVMSRWNRERFGNLAIWLASGAVCAALAVGVCVLLFGPVFLTDMLHHPRVIDFSRILGGARRTSEILALGLVAMTLIGSRVRALHGRLLVLAAVCSIFWTLIQRAGEGVAMNAWFEPLTVLSILTGVALSVAARREPDDVVRGPARLASHAGAGGLLLVALLPFLVSAGVVLPRALHHAVHIGAEARGWRAFVDKVRQRPGSVGCSMASICYWAGKDNVVDVFNYTEYVATGGDPALLTRLLYSHALSGFVLPDDFRETDSDQKDREHFRQKELLKSAIDHSQPGPVSPDGKLRLYFFGL
ncbi:hypothetical protein [Acetobacter oeni]|uniref:Glycosyltransferase RgtA/B/C/D-like domain-containing protein n=1 Tax=Acetobacter oeni TaxID=304077 RepID=A0A511XFP8_9PROT|nr:hypothetical protein [Acetobacter oeni]MBB3882300.1 hypothetical protein [Acetobacter oeni]NHO18052.1 hypothetical protein [Acetobacter oeni]GBR01067.1 hypothetical protein AA21952_0301 [Acetobacter oeni LMG 21952]GEN61780.1 hypothetical protein AOE01nite_00040 [Acetobacter oeni]